MNLPWQAQAAGVLFVLVAFGIEVAAVVAAIALIIDMSTPEELR